ncbi:TetR/AcrR family transcriptional regulator [Alkalihalobacillus pseudalcaliphilus]|uniref:TetR/AcrR family transcriptional regulator n=1 Tax=Alkalihalobacillus pseudalcaliphilus TaxID=79884 RepID=UPI00064DB224|nr:TetR/AcrR family transcriptional regulator [Alkalihalobacillus pseudalcaliphilus]KMK76532.1 TetR family transcriptional regulator [Alkalihalobacillus pseudalcaliphilus]
MAKPNVITKEDLINSAKECLIQNGIEKFTLRSVAEMAGVTQGTIYYHFKTKEQLYLDIVNDICTKSWKEISQQSNPYSLSEAVESAKSRSSYDSTFHKLFLSLIVSSFNNEKMRKQLGEIIQKENNELTKKLLSVWSISPINGISIEAWGIFINAIVDGIALQALVQKDFPVDKTFKELELLFKGLTHLLNKGD